MTNARILVVEDEFIVGEGLRTNLDELGFDVLSVVPSGEEAIEVAEKQRPDLVLMDIVLQGEMDGIEAANEIRSRLPTAVLFLTAYADDETLKRACISEPNGYLVKPFRMRELKASIEMALYKSRSEKRIQELLDERAQTIDKLEESLELVKQLSGIIPICSSCKKIRDEDGKWLDIESYVRFHSEAEFSHSFCPDCFKRLYPDIDEES